MSTMLTMSVMSATSACSIRAAFALLTLLGLATLVPAPALAGDANLARELTDRAIELQKKGDDVLALNFFDRALKELEHPKIRYFRAKSLVALDLQDEALSEFERIKDEPGAEKYRAEILAFISSLKAARSKRQLEEQLESERRAREALEAERERLKAEAERARMEAEKAAADKAAADKAAADKAAADKAAADKAAADKAAADAGAAGGGSPDGGEATPAKGAAGQGGDPVEGREGATDGRPGDAPPDAGPTESSHGPQAPMVAGWVTLGLSYVLSAALGLAFVSTGSDADNTAGWEMLIPVAGPWLAFEDSPRNTKTHRPLTALAGALQLTGLVLGITGTVLYHVLGDDGDEAPVAAGLPLPGGAALGVGLLGGTRPTGAGLQVTLGF